MKWFCKVLTLVLGLAGLLPGLLWAEGEPKFYIYGYAYFLNKSKWSKTMEHFTKKYPMKRDSEGDRSGIIPVAAGAKYFSPGPNDKLWVFHDSKLAGTAKVKEYMVGGGGYQSDHIWYHLNKKFEFSGVGEVVHNVVDVSIPVGTSEKDLPKEFHPPEIPAKEVREILLRLGQDDPNVWPAFTPTFTFTPTETKPPTMTPIPTATLTPTFLEKIGNRFKSSDSTPKDVVKVKYEGWNNGPATPIPTETPLPWEEKIKSIKIIKSMDFPKEGVKFLEITWPKGDSANAKRFIYFLGGKIYEVKQLPDNSETGNLYNWLDFDQTFEVMGKYYITFYGNSGVSDGNGVFRIDPDAIVKIDWADIAYD